jgi:hypothetical protein
MPPSVLSIPPSPVRLTSNPSFNSEHLSPEPIIASYYRVLSCSSPPHSHHARLCHPHPPLVSNSVSPHAKINPPSLRGPPNFAFFPQYLNYLATHSRRTSPRSPTRPRGWTLTRPCNSHNVLSIEWLSLYSNSGPFSSTLVLSCRSNLGRQRRHNHITRRQVPNHSCRPFDVVFLSAFHEHTTTGEANVILGPFCSNLPPSETKPIFPPDLAPSKPPYHLQLQQQTTSPQESRRTRTGAHADRQADAQVASAAVFSVGGSLAL